MALLIGKETKSADDTLRGRYALKGSIIFHCGPNLFLVGLPDHPTVFIGADIDNFTKRRVPGIKELNWHLKQISFILRCTVSHQTRRTREIFSCKTTETNNNKIRKPMAGETERVTNG